MFTIECQWCLCHFQPDLPLYQFWYFYNLYPGQLNGSLRVLSLFGFFYCFLRAQASMALQKPLTVFFAEDLLKTHHWLSLSQSVSRSNHLYPQMKSQSGLCKGGHSLCSLRSLQGHWGEETHPPPEKMRNTVQVMHRE